MRLAPDANGCFVGDYEGLSALGTTFYPFWSQSDDKRHQLVFAATARGAVPTAAGLHAFGNEGATMPASAFPVIRASQSRAEANAASAASRPRQTPPARPVTPCDGTDAAQTLGTILTRPRLPP